METTVKICTKCKCFFDSSGFYKYTKNTPTLRSICKKCSNKGNKAWRTKHRSQRRKYERAYKKAHKDRIKQTRRILAVKNPAQKMLSDAKQRARKTGVNFSLVSTDIFVPKVCPILGIPLFVGKGKQGPNSPSLDRIDSKLGYTSENVMVMSYKANAMKQNASRKELLTFARWVIKTYV